MKLLDKIRKRRIAKLKDEIKEYEKCYKETYELLGYEDKWILSGILSRQDEIDRIKRKLRKKKARRTCEEDS